MTATLISLLSIFIGILGGNSIQFVFKKKSLGLIGNTIVGVFGSVFLIKSFGRLGFDPQSILISENLKEILLFTNLIISFIGGLVGVFFVYWIRKKMNK